MIIIRWYTIRTVMGIYLIALLLFIIALQLVEVVTNLVQYIQLNVPISTILQLQLLFLPSSVHFALPISMLFATSFSMGNFHNTRELLAVFGSGINLMQFCVPIFIFALCVSVFSFWLENNVVVNARAGYNSLRESILLINPSSDDQFVAIFGGDGNDVYYAEHFDRATQVLSKPILIERDIRGFITRRISAARATWNGDYWLFEDAHSYVWNEQDDTVAHTEHGNVRIVNLDITPQEFGDADLQIDEMNLTQAREYIISRRRTGLPFREELTTYYKRFAFSCTTLVVALISCGIGAFLRKNTLLLSMLISLGITVIYYVAGLLIDLLAFNGYLAPAFAAWLPVLLFLGGGGFALKNFSQF